MLELSLFGPGALRVDDGDVPAPAPKELALLAYLALHQAPVARRDLAEVLWQGSGTGAMRVALSRLRALPGSEAWLEADATRATVRAESDVARFERALADGDGAAALRHWPAEAGELLAGLELRGAEPFMEWLETERARLRGMRAEARRRQVEALERQGDAAGAATRARELLAEDPLDESAHRALMRLQHAMGDTDAALAQFEQLRVRLRDELGVEPLPETLEALAAIEGGGGAGERARALRTPGAVPGRVAPLLGRDDALAAVERALADGGRALLHGAGGMGKSALAAEVVARRLADGAPAGWVEAGNADPATVFDALAAAFDARAEVAGSAEPARALATCLEREGVRLVTLDDAWNAYTVARVAEALPSGCALLVTSRQRYPGLARVRLGRLERAPARALLEHHAGRALGEDDATALCALLGDHPFALRVAGVTLADADTDAATLMARLRAAPHALALPPELAEPGRGSVAALLEVSLAALPDDAYEALMALAALPTPAATPELLAELVRRPTDAVDAALATLQGRALAERLAEPGSDIVRYRVHDLTHSLARANTHVRGASANGACLRHLANVSSRHALLDADLANVVHAVQATLDSGATAGAVQAMARLAGPDGYFNGRGHTPASLALLARAADEAETIDAAASQLLHVKLGNARRELLRDPEAARASYARAVELAAALGDRGREAIARSLVGAVTIELGGADGGKDGGKDGERELELALTLARASGDDLALAHALQNLGFVAGLRERHAEAVLLSEEAVQVADRLGPDVDPQEADHKRFFARFNLGVARWLGGDADAGRAALEDALRVARQRGTPAWEAYALQELAELEEAAGRAERAVDHARAARALYLRHRMRADAEAVEAWLADHGAEGGSGGGTEDGTEDGTEGGTDPRPVREIEDDPGDTRDNDTADNDTADNDAADNDAADEEKTTRPDAGQVEAD